ncbi:D-tyrosyl-tRNA(Tyr) deacylase [Candidatus Kuenenbacteria bacterium]|nr:D-tyrosyl-tRNA(Tyr) deacylase [Candidatus Kuenenbacteria bacterium]
MKILLQRVTSASVEVESKVVGQIGSGLLVFLGVGKEDFEAEVDFLVEKLINMRVFPVEDKHFDKSLLEVDGEVLVISQFTLYGNCEKGRRPDFFASAGPEKAEELYNKFIEKLKTKNIKVESGEFGAYMQVKLVNDGPSTFLLEK